MLKREENELITELGQARPWANTMRRYWMPVVLLIRAAEPGQRSRPRAACWAEDLIAFRDTNGQVGLVAAKCPHPRRSLFFGRNEAAGSAASTTAGSSTPPGSCVDMPTNRPSPTFDQSQSVAYPTARKADSGLGLSRSAGKATTVPDLEVMRAPKGHTWVSKTFENCN